MTTEDKIKKLEEQKAILAKKIRLEKNKLNAKKRKKRTKRLIEKGAILEKIQGKDAENISPEETFKWLKGLQKTRTKHQFMLPRAEKWTTFDENGIEMTVLERLSREWKVERNKTSEK